MSNLNQRILLDMMQAGLIVKLPYRLAGHRSHLFVRVNKLFSKTLFKPAQKCEKDLKQLNVAHNNGDQGHSPLNSFARLPCALINLTRDSIQTILTCGILSLRLYSKIVGQSEFSIDMLIFAITFEQQYRACYTSAATSST